MGIRAIWLDGDSKGADSLAAEGGGGEQWACSAEVSLWSRPAGVVCHPWPLEDQGCEHLELASLPGLNLPRNCTF